MATYMEKEIAIIEKLKATGYAAFGGSRAEALGFVEKQLAGLAGYAGAARRGGGDPHGRDAAIEGVAAAIDALDRLSADLGLEPFAGVDTSDPQAVAAVAGGFAREMFLAGARGMEARPGSAVASEET